MLVGIVVNIVDHFDYLYIIGLAWIVYHPSRAYPLRLILYLSESES